MQRELSAPSTNKCFDIPKDEFLMHSMHIINLPLPNYRDTCILRKWLIDPKGGASFYEGLDSNPYHRDFWHDLVSLKADRRNKDRLSTFLENNLIPLLPNRWGHRRRIPDPHSQAEAGFHPNGFTPLFYYSSSPVSNIVAAIITLLACTLTVVPVFILWQIHNPLAQLGVISCVTFSFSAVSTIFTGASRMDTFMAGAAITGALSIFVTGLPCNASP